LIAGAGPSCARLHTLDVFEATLPNMPAVVSETLRGSAGAFPGRRLAFVVAEDVLAVSGNLAAAGRIGWALLPSTSVAGRCVATGAPALIEAHTSIQRCYFSPSSVLGDGGVLAEPCVHCTGISVRNLRDATVQSR
jgi:hypothetical protein